MKDYFEFDIHLSPEWYVPYMKIWSFSNYTDEDQYAYERMNELSLFGLKMNFHLNHILDQEKTGFDNSVLFMKLIDKKTKSDLVPLIDKVTTLTTSKDLNIQLGFDEVQEQVSIQNPVSWKRFKFEDENLQSASMFPVSDAYSKLLPTA